MESNPHIVFAGGGTAGHLFPGLATAEALVRQMPGARITFAGGGKPFERERVTAAGFEYLAVPCRPLPRRAREAVSFVLENYAGYLAARRFLADERVDAVVGLGGYASVPMGRAARRLRLPLVLLEQNAVPGRATRWLARRADLVCLSMPEAANSLRCRGEVQATGNPIRAAWGRLPTCPQSALGRQLPDSLGWQLHCHPALADTRHGSTTAAPTNDACPTPQQLLILGGSGGARTLNENVPPALYRLRDELGFVSSPFAPRKLRSSSEHKATAAFAERKATISFAERKATATFAERKATIGGWRIVHQTGEAGLDATRELYRKLGIDATVAAFFDDLPAVLAASTAAVCRAGGTTLAELAAAGVPALLLPYPHATGDHQRRNAEVFVKAGGAAMLDEREVSGRLDHRLADALRPLLSEAGRRVRMSLALGRLARPDAAETVAALIAGIAAGRSHRLAAAAA